MRALCILDLTGTQQLYRADLKAETNPVIYAEGHV